MIDRDALSRAVSEKSPLSLEQVELLFHGVSDENKRAVWAFLTKPHVHQKAAWQTFLRVQHYFPAANVLATKDLSEQIKASSTVSNEERGTRDDESPNGT
jgi:hypothetical protein